MVFTVHRTRLAATIDTHVTEVLSHRGGDAALLMSMADDIGTL
jgi:hypothetical protein